jgi:hypothetical protein
MTGSKRMDHWTSGTVYEYSEIAGSPQFCSSERTMFVLRADVVMIGTYELTDLKLEVSTHTVTGVITVR